MVTNGILTNVLNENTLDSTKLSRHSENAIKNNMVLRCQASIQAAMKAEYEIWHKQGVQRTTTPLSPWVSGSIALSLTNRLKTVRVSHWPITWPIYLPCTVTQGRSHCAFNIISNSHPFHSKWVDIPISELQQFQYFTLKIQAQGQSLKSQC